MNENKRKELTFISGAPVIDNDNTLTGGPLAPMLIQDHWYLEKLAHFARERIPERVVHAKAVGAYGEFTVTHDITQYTKAKLFSEVGKKTKLFGRFSIVKGERGHPDAIRDVRGFALKFYTEEGNWDMVGNNTPVFFLRDPLKFPDFIHTQKRDPKTNLHNNAYAWDYWSLSPESYHQVMILMSDRGIPTDIRHMDGYGSHTFSFINKDNKRFWVKFHFKSQQGNKFYTDEEAAEVAGQDPDSSQTDLVNAINNGDYPKWKFYIQVMKEEEAYHYHIHPFDLTKVWPHKDYPLIEVGEIVLNQIPENYYQDVEEATFTPANVVPGIGFSPDRVLQGRIFSYGDAHRYRVGVNSYQIPVNRPVCPIHNTYRDGAMRLDGNEGSTVNYAPNNQAEYIASHDYEPPLRTEKEAKHYQFDDYDQDYFSQPRALYEKVFSEPERMRLAKNIANHMKAIDNEEVLNRAIDLWGNVSQRLPQDIRSNLKKLKENE